MPAAGVVLAVGQVGRGLGVVVVVCGRGAGAGAGARWRLRSCTARNVFDTLLNTL